MKQKTGLNRCISSDGGDFLYETGMLKNEQPSMGKDAG